MIKNKNLQDNFPNTEIASRTDLNTAITNCRGEHSFSTLKRVKSYLHNGHRM